MALSVMEELAQNLNNLAKSNPTMAAQTGVSNIGSVTANDVQKSYDSGDTITGTNGLVKALTAQKTPAATVAPAVDNSGLISSQYSSLVAALKAQIAQNVNNKNLSISGLTDKYQPDKNNSEVQKYSQINTLNEMAANAGDRGGIGRQNTLQAMVGGENRLNTINLQQKSEEASLRNDIANLTLEGNIQEAQYKAQELRDLIANNTNVDNTNYARTTAAENTATQNSQWQQSYELQAKTAEANQKASAIEQQINQLKLASLPQEQQIALEKAQLELDQLKAVDPTLQTQTAQIKLAQMQAELDQTKAQTSQIYTQTNKINSTGSTNSTTEQNINYQDALTQYANVKGEDIYNELMSDQASITSQIGSANFNKLIGMAQDKVNQTLIANWANSDPADIVSSLTNDEEYWRTMLGDANYYKMLATARQTAGVKTGG